MIFKGGIRTRDEMCLHMFTYYPRMNDIYTCVNLNHYSAWEKMLNSSSIDEQKIEDWLKNQTWTEESKNQWQRFYDHATRNIYYGRSGHFQSRILPTFPIYTDLKTESCQNLNYN